MRARSAALALTAALTAALLAPAGAPAAFGLKDLAVGFEEKGGAEARQAGAHPHSFETVFAFETAEAGLGFEVPDGSTRDLIVSAPAGLAGKPAATPRCTTLRFGAEACPAASQVGETAVTFGDPDTSETAPVFNLAPPPGAAARLGFHIGKVPVTIDAGVNPDPPYNILAKLRNIPQVLPVYGAVTTIWGTPGGPEDPPFLTAPRACEGPLPTVFEARSWEQPGVWVGGQAQSPGFAGCEKLGFAPRLSTRASSRAASAPSGLEVGIEIDDEGLESPTGLADSDVKRLELTLPEGMTANPSLAAGLETCSPAAYAAEALDSAPGEGCPQAAKIGTVQVETPLLEDELLEGQIFIASQGENPFGSLLALYVVIRDPELGILVKLAGRVEPDPRSGRLTAIFGEPGHELPQFPLSSVRTQLREGARSPLITPPRCGTHTVEATFTPWADPSKPRRETASFEIDNGPNGAPCPRGATPPFEPGFEAGSADNAAGSHSPFQMRLTRRDGDADLTRFDAVLPPGVSAKLAGVARCPDALIALAKAKSGRRELAAPSCPATSRIGSVLGGAGVGAQLVYVPGSVYLAGPVGGAPLSVVGIVPAVAGPFDVGTIVVRQALDLDPRTGEARVNGALSDPIPHILAGIPLAVRDIRVNVDRPQFTLNPTNCTEKRTLAGIWGGGADAFSRADDFPVLRQARYQAAGCAALGFEPKLAIKLKGGTRRGAHPGLRAIVTPRPGDANFSRAVVTLPRSAFLDQAHIRTICTRVQFAAPPGHGAQCPPGARYGYARAWSPLLDEPAQGPVYLRSSDNKLPDLVVALNGPASAPVEVELSSRIDSVRGGIRSTFTAVPDLPVSRFVLAMQGGKKGLIVNSRNLCHKPKRNRAKANLVGQNGRLSRGRPVVRAVGCAKGRKAR